MAETMYPPAMLEIAQKRRDLRSETQAAFDAFSSKAAAGAPSGCSAKSRWNERRPSGYMRRHRHNSVCLPSHRA
jgi:hypothetical protein